MEIQKRLILNRTPKDMPYGSISCAKNMMVDDTGSFLTNDIGFTEVFNVFKDETVDDPGNFENIVGVIPCNNELIIFTYNTIDHESYIYRKPDDVSITYDNMLLYRVNTYWRWNGGKLCGSYTYNYKGELIIALGEYDVPGNIMVPMKCWNLDNSNYYQTHNIEETIPKYDTSYSVNLNGSLLCGVYTFFIRFKIDEFNYTKWFQITGDINIIQESLSKKYSHAYLKNNDTLAEPINLDSFTVNSNAVSNKCIVLSLSFENYNFSKYQLGYIIKRDSDIRGRIQGEYVITPELQKVSIVNNNFIEETSVDLLLETVNQLFDVKNIVNYNNRLYITNYKEYPVEDLSSFAINNTEVSINSPSVDSPSIEVRSSTNKRWTIELKIKQVREYRYTETNDTVEFRNLISDANGVLDLDSKAAFINGITQYLKILVIRWTNISWGNTNVPNMYWFIQSSSDFTNAGTTCIAKHLLDGASDPARWGWNFNIQDYDIKIIENNNTTDIVLEYIEGGVTKSYSLLRTNGEHSCLLAYYSNLSTDFVFFGNGYDHELGGAFQPGTEMPNDIRLSVIRAESRDEDSPGGDDDDNPEESGGENKDPGVNTRTLHPYQKYNFFIHYIREDGSNTLGFPITLETKSYNVSEGNTVIIPKFSAKKPAGNYIGYFITYENVESTVDCIYITGFTGGSEENKAISFTNASYLFDLDNIRGNKIFIDDVEYSIQAGTLKYIENRLTNNHIESILAESGSMNTPTKRVAYWIKNINNIYNNKNKVLYRLTKNIYTWDEEIEDCDYLPAFYNSQLIIKYVSSTSEEVSSEIIIDPANSFVNGFSINSTTGESRTEYNVKINAISMYSQYPTEAMNIKEDFQQAAVTLHRYTGTEYKDTLRVNTVISPDKLHDFLELKAGYMAKPSKSYTNFNENNIYIFDKTVRRSDVISDESLVNGFRHFDINNYKNILENKGKIVNIIGIGLYFIVHTEQSIFVFDRSPKLTSKSQLDIPDTFDIDYQDIMPSNEGFGGLTEKEEAILTKNGYIWFDKTNKLIFRYENGKADIISKDINNFIKALNISKVRFAEDIIYNRLLVCIYFINNNVESNITLSYNFNTNSFISLHDYKFTDNFRTANASYVLDKDTQSILYKFDNTKRVEYGELKTQGDSYFPYYSKRLTDPNTVTGKSYIDVIFNNDYFSIKQVDSIRYILSEIVGTVYPYKITEEQLERHYSGNELKIYTDETDSGDLNIEINKEKINDLNDYKHPYYDKGCWNLNYFRNKISTLITDTELIADAQKLGIDPDKYIEANSYDSSHLMSSDSRSLIYGKYIVVRFIFNNDVNVKLEGVDVNINRY